MHTKNYLDLKQEMRDKRENLRKAFDAYEGVLERAMIDGPLGPIERKNAEISCVQVQSARRVVWMD